MLLDKLDSPLAFDRFLFLSDNLILNQAHWRKSPCYISPSAWLALPLSQPCVNDKREKGIMPYRSSLVTEKVIDSLASNYFASLTWN